MNGYNKVLMALDFHSDNEQIIVKGQQICADHQAELHLLHVMEPISTAYTLAAVDFANQMVAMKQTIRENAKQQLLDIGERLGVSSERLLHCEGVASDEIHRAAKELDIDLIVIGTHGQSGLRSLLGSTANSVLHNVGCDVLMVRLKD
ncbi:universal stress protein [uncultured Ferrimonas sp.]|uniref:universal stress protein n=1 Tax=uncultured Ferrimonas sp. TaxID=432640 RepID=UPI0026294FE7|nr:universal stress protein [uncultured Ferrimonas sp.]